MAYLEILHLTGESERRELSKTQPLSIGSHSSNDIRIEDDDVELMHCRVAWNKTGYEAVAAGTTGLEVNGNLVQRTMLKGGETLRFGSVDVRFRSGDSAVAEVPADADEEDPPASAKSKPAAKGARGREQKAVMGATRDEPSWDALEALAQESRSSGEMDAEDAEDVIGASDLLDDIDEDDVVAETPAAPPAKKSLPPRSEPKGSSAEAADAGKEPGAAAAVTGRLREALRKQQRRPGSEDTARSPIVLGLGGGAAVLLLVGATFYFMINRQTTEDAFNEGKGLYEEGKYGNAISSLTDFLGVHPQHELSQPARIYRGMAEVDQEVKTRREYPKGLEKLQNFITDFQDYEEFEQHRPFVADRARIIALEAAQQAGRSRNDELLTTSDDARRVFTIYAAQDIKPQEMIAQIEAAKRASQAAILKFRTQSASTAEVDAALKRKDTMAAIAAWRNLIGRYPDLRQDAKVAGLLQKVLDAERDRVTTEEVEIAATKEEAARDIPEPLSLLFHARSRTDEVSGGRAVLAVAKDCCYGVDTVTGAPVWRRVIGQNSPFFPVIDSATSSAILFDTRSNEVVRIDINSGKLHWRTPIDAVASGAPLLTGGRLLLPTEDGHLFEVDLDSGSVSRRVRFSQAISTPALMQDGERATLAGDQEVFYTLNISSLECERVEYLGDGFPAGSIRAPLLPMGPYILACENSSGGDSCQLQVLDTQKSPGRLAVAATANVAGLVVDPPVIRGQDLFVPSTGERVSAFTVSDTPGQPILTVGPVYPGEGKGTAPIYLSTGPERQVWMASTAVRRLQITGDQLAPDQNVVATGLVSQPLQYIDRHLFHGRKRPYTDAVTFTRMDRESLTGDTQAVLGANLLAWSPYDEGGGSLVVGNEAGIVFRITPEQWNRGGILAEGAERLPVHGDLQEPLYSTPLDKGQLAVATGGPEPKVWVISRIGRMDRSFPLTGSPTAAPSFLAGRVLVPMQGRLKLVTIASGQGVVEDFSLPTDELESAKWKFVVAAGENDAIGVLEQGAVILVRYQTSPRHYLGQIARVGLDAPVHVKGDQADGLLAVADGDSNVHLFETDSLNVRARRKLPAAVSGDVYMAGEWIFVETGRSELHCLARDQDLSTVWTLPLEGSSLAGRPLLQGEQLVIPLQDGRVLFANAADGAVVRTVATGQGLASDAFSVGGETFVATLDGSLVRLTAKPAAQGEATP